MTTAGVAPTLLCGVRGRICAIPLADVVETMRPLPIEPVAAAPAFVLGLAIVRGRPLPVVDVGHLVVDGDGGGGGVPARFVTVRAGAREVVLAVDHVIGVRDLPALGTLPPLLRDAGRDVVDAIGTLDGELLFMLRGARIVADALEAVA